MSQWAKRVQAIQVGDTVAYSRKFLQSTGQYTGDIPHARGTVTALIPLGKDVTLAEIDWKNPEIPTRVHVANLTTVQGIQRGE